MSQESSIPPERIILTGFMASGKSSVGRMLGKRLGYTFVDLDDQIRIREGKSVRAVFGERGEKRFREVEREVLEEVLSMDRIVLSTGGGALVDPENMRRAKGAGLVIWLRVNAGTVLHRVRDPRTRPLLCDANGEPLEGEALRHRIERLIAEREPAYGEAHLAVDANKSSRRVARTLAKQLLGKSEE